MADQIVTIAPPTPNGDLHLGHISGPYLAADVYTRAQRLCGSHIVLLCYSDDYQSYLARKARELGVERFALARENGTRIHETLKMMDIALDWFHQAGHNAHFRRSVTLFYQAARQAGAIYSQREAIPYFPAFDVWGYEAFGRGTCNYCGTPSDASQCEHCAYTPTLAAMLDIRCTLGESAVQWRTIEREFLCLNAFRSYLRTLYNGRPLRPYLRAYIDQILTLPDINWGITRPHEYGLELDEPGQPNVHTWFSGIAGYHAAFSEWAASQGRPELVKTYWASADTSLVCFLGFDCSFSHAIVYPVLLSLADGFCRDISLYTNRFLKLENQDFSTSRGHAIWVRDILESYTPDAVRYYLALHSPEEVVNNFVMTDFRNWHERVFVGRLRRLLTQAAQARGYGFDIPAHLSPRVNAALYDWQRYADPQHFSMCGLATVCETMLDGFDIEFVHDQRVLGTALAVYATLASPVHPHLSEQLFAQLGIDARAASAWLQHALGGDVRVPAALTA